MILNTFIQILQICFCSDTPNTTNRSFNLQYSIGRKNKEILIYFKDNVEFRFKIKPLKKFKYLQKLLSKKPECLKFLDFDLEHFRCLIDLRSNSVPITEKTFKYFLDKKFISLYHLLTETEGFHKSNLFIEIDFIVKQHLSKCACPLKSKLNKYICQENLTFNFDLIYSTIYFLPVVLECENARLYIKFIFNREINPKTNLPTLKRIIFEITEKLQRESTNDRYKAKIHIFFEFMRLIYLRHKDVPIEVFLFALTTYSRTFIDRFSDYLRNINDEHHKMFEKIKKGRVQLLNYFVEKICFVFKIENRQNLEDFFDKEVEGKRYIGFIKLLYYKGFINI